MFVKLTRGFVALTFVAVSLVVASPAGAIRAGQPGKFYVTPPTLTVARGTTFTVDVYYDTRGTPVNVVDVQLQYPKGRLTCVSSQPDAAAWDIAFQPAGPCANGKIQIVVGDFSFMDGILHIGTVTFTTTNLLGKAKVAFTAGSMAVSAAGVDASGKAASGVYTVVK